MPMPSVRHALLLTTVALATACQSYEPEPVDLAAHADAFSSRLPDLAAVRAFVTALDQNATTPDDGIDLATAHRIALWFHADLRQLRAAAMVAEATAEHAGLLPDPYFQGSVADKLGNVNPWLITTAIGFTVPLSGQLSLQKELASVQHGRARLAVLAREVEVRDQLDVAWVHFSAATQKVALLQSLVDDLTALQAIADRLAAANEITQQEARAFSLERMQRRSELARSEAEAAAARLAIDELLGLPPGNDLALLPRLQIDSRAPDASERLAELRGSPHLALLLRDHDERERALELAISRQWPSLVLAPGWEEEDAINRPVLNFSVPLPLWNRNAQAIATARGEREAAATALRTGYERAARSLHRAELARRAATAERALVETELVPLCERQLQDVHRLAELGRLDPLLILDALSRAFAARAATLDAAIAEAEAIAAENAHFWPADAMPAATTAPTTTEPR